MHLILGIVFPLAPLVILRGQAREKKGIEVADYKHPLSCVLRGFYIGEAPWEERHLLPNMLKKV